MTQTPAVQPQLAAARRRPAADTHGRQLVAQPVDQGLRHGLARQQSLESMPQQIGGTRTRQRRQPVDLERGLAVEHGRQIDLGQFAQAAGCFMRPPPGLAQGLTRIRKGLQQDRPDGFPQSTAREVGAAVARIVHPAQAMSCHVVFDRSTRAGQPGPHPVHTMAFGMHWHGGEPARRAPSQGLEQEGLSLVLPVMGQQDEVAVVFMCHPGQGLVTLVARPGFDAGASPRRTADTAHVQRHREAGAAPASALALQVRLPGICVGHQAVMHVQCQDFDAMFARPARRAMQECGRVTAATDGHRHAGGRHGISARWCRCSAHRPATARSVAAADPWA